MAWHAVADGFAGHNRQTEKPDVVAASGVPFLQSVNADPVRRIDGTGERRF